MSQRMHAYQRKYSQGMKYACCSSVDTVTDPWVQIHAHLLHTCFTFSQYSYSFNKQATQIIDAYNATGEIDLNDQHLSMEKRWAFLHKFEHNFNHYFKVSISCIITPVPILMRFTFRFITTACNSSPVARTRPCLLSLFD
jgi:hypothetical protein